MNQHVPYIWRKNYRNDAAAPEKMLEIAHEKARKILGSAINIDEMKSRQQTH
jgi:hypothetical protein